MATKRELRQAWSGKKAPLVERRFEATVALDGDKAIALQEMANRHRELGYRVKTEHTKFRNGTPALHVVIEHGDHVADSFMNKLCRSFGVLQPHA